MVGCSLGLLKYFKRCSKNSCDLLLPNPHCSSNKTLDRSAIEEANNKITTVISFSSTLQLFPNDRYPAILKDMKSTDTTFCFKPFHHCKGPGKGAFCLAIPQNVVLHVHITRVSMFTSLLNQGTIKVFQRFETSFYIRKTFPPRMICNIRYQPGFDLFTEFF